MQVNFNITTTLNERIANDEQTAKAVNTAVEKFINCNWGELPPEDIAANNEDLKNCCGHILARYPAPDEDIYINMYLNDTAVNEALIMYVGEY